MKLSNYEIGKTIGEGAFGKVAIKIMNIEKLKEMNANQKKIQENVDKILIKKARQRAYDKVLQQISKDPALVEQNKDENGINLTQFISKVKQDTTKAMVFEKPPSVSNSLTSFQQEALLMMRFKHPNIIKIYKVFESPDDVYIVMAYAYNGDLASHVSKHGYLTELEARRIFRQIISAVDFIHLSHVVHRDLKMENILLDQHCNALVTDFGLGRAFQISDYMKTFCGTPTYSPPEMISAKPYNGTKIDIWAMGIILYGMVAGNLPFMGDTVTSLFQKIREMDYEIPEHFSWEITALLRLILVEDPDTRIDMESLRFNRWVNINCDYPPQRMEANLTNKEALAKLISSITVENNITIYNINYHKNVEMAKDIEQFEKHRRKSSSKTIVKLKRRKSISVGSDNSIASSSSSLHVPTPTNGSRVSCVENYENSKTISQNHLSLVRSHSLTDTPTTKQKYLLNGKEISRPSREVSFINRMSKVSDKSNIEEEFSVKDISEWHLTHKPPSKIRTMKFNFKKGLISTLDPPSIFQDLHRALVELKPVFKLNITKPSDYYIFHVEMESASLDIELCKVWLLNVHGLKISKVGECGEFVDALIAKLAW
ncbi:hypothetical protein HK103_005319 [Boothiomyces macroporosus]|uniref:Protein kinase domain-containing protein n=1 Tax=Boothiomyces macroporosus TaxID=261099 RepID=A0AAD5ULJ2_9FUNG|nr:hypothetical protein HK103_005319 [Boothiomyces macroporosus]